MALDLATMEKLNEYQQRGDSGRTLYYQTLEAAKDPYGRLALSVVKQDLMQGKAAYSYAMEVAKRYCRPISKDEWITISVTLMRRDYAARTDTNNFEPGKPSLAWFVIRNYHAETFRNVSLLPPIVWTAWIPPYLQGEAKDEKLWHRMLNEGFVKIGVQTAAMVLSRWAQKAGVSKELWNSVAPILTNAPPVATGVRPQDPDFDRCMKRLAPEQMTKDERLAAFYIDCLACAVNVASVIPFPHNDIYGPDFGPNVGDLGRIPLPF